MLEMSVEVYLGFKKRVRIHVTSAIEEALESKVWMIKGLQGREQEGWLCEFGVYWGQRVGPQSTE